MWFIGLLPTDRPASKLLFKYFICFTLPIRVLVNSMYTRNSTLPGTEGPGSHCEVKIQESYPLKEFWYYLVLSPYLNKWENSFREVLPRAWSSELFLPPPHLPIPKYILVSIPFLNTFPPPYVYPVHEYWLLRIPFHTFPFNFSWTSPTLLRSTLNGML